MEYQLSKDQFKHIYLEFIVEEDDSIKNATIDTETHELFVNGKNLNVNDSVYYSILRGLQKDEAIKRLEILKLHPNVLKEFKKEGTIYYSERLNQIFDGLLYWVSNVKEYEQVIKEFEEKHNALVYHAQLAKFEFGTCLSLLFVSQYAEEWEQDKQDLEIMHPYAYVVNLDIPEYSECGRIGIVRKNGGISRIY